MLKLVAALALLGALAVGVLFVPLGGRTIADRWNASPGPAQFAASAWSEVRGLHGAASAPRRSPTPPNAGAGGKSTAQRDDARARRSPAEPLPVEHHSAEDRAALDRLLSERSR